MSSRNTNQERAVQHWLKNHWGYVPQLSIPGSVTFRHKVTGHEITKTVNGLELEYNGFKAAKEEKRKAMLRSIDRNVTPKRRRKRKDDDQLSLV